MSYEPRKAGAFTQEGKPYHWYEVECECPRCHKANIAIMEHDETEIEHECVHCDKSFNVGIGE